MIARPHMLALVAVGSVGLAIAGFNGGCAFRLGPDKPVPAPSLTSGAEQAGAPARQTGEGVAEASISTVQSSPAIKWPERDRAALGAVLAPTPFPIHLFSDTGDGLPPDASPRLRRAVERPLATVHYNAPLGQGVLRELANRDEPAHSANNALRFVSVSTHPIRPVDERGNPWRWFVRSQAGLGAGAPVAINESQVLTYLGEGLRMQIFDPPDGVDRRGLIVYLHGLGSRVYEAPIVEAARADGWVILQVSTPRVWFYKPVKFEIRRSDDIDRVAGDIAALIDDQLAEPAYAVEAALAYLRQQRPDIPSRPAVVMGFSAGALFAPAVVARNHGQIDAAVLVGGGANLLRISQTSDLTNGGLDIRWPTIADRDRFGTELEEAYARHVQLDPVRTAATLRDKPTLLVLAALDSTVPASTARTLRREVPHAQRIVFPVGHRLMFWLLEGQRASIVRWLRDATATD
ncbi:MAG: alpha/beta fold hydrolase [Phycisphaeraceae bacterium]|nr:alpha/beta fold hydrolase [Phycisphaeraceae bacterium]